MTRSIFRLALTTLALVTMFAGSFNVIRTSANSGGGGDSVTLDYAGDSAAPSKCQELAGCPGGPTTCGTIQLPDGTTIRCGLQ